MTTESQQQIAQEAAEEQWPWLPPKSAQVQKTKQIILSAIERAGPRKFACLVCGKGARELASPHYLERVSRTGKGAPAFWICTEHIAAPPQRSEQKEWTKRQYIDKISGRPRDSWDIYEGRRIIVGDLAEEECDKLCDAHNGALAAKCQHREQQEWTPETVRQLWRENQRKELQDDEQWNTFFKSVADAHNAALKQMLKMVEALEWISSECGREAGLKADDTLFEIREGK